MAKKKIIGQDGNEYEVKIKKPFYKRWWFILIMVIFAIGVIGNLTGSKDDKSAKDDNVKISSQKEADAEESNSEVIEESSSESKTVESSAPVTPAVPIEYKNALIKAETYSKMMHMSKQAIYDQLTSEAGEKFPAEAAQYAVDNLKADYNANALEKAKTYQSMMSMSTDAIYDQLTSSAGEKFTPEEAQYAINNLNK